VARRSSFAIDRDGIVRWAVHNQLSDGRDLDDHLAHLHHLA
jgi:alkyl hydroperoxide reductase subunit AhpC